MRGERRLGRRERARLDFFEKREREGEGVLVFFFFRQKRLCFFFLLLHFLSFFPSKLLRVSKEENKITPPFFGGRRSLSLSLPLPQRRRPHEKKDALPDPRGGLLRRDMRRAQRRLLPRPPIRHARAMEEEESATGPMRLPDQAPLRHQQVTTSSLSPFPNAKKMIESVRVMPAITNCGPKKPGLDVAWARSLD